METPRSTIRFWKFGSKELRGDSIYISANSVRFIDHHKRCCDPDKTPAALSARIEEHGRSQLFGLHKAENQSHF